LTLCGRDCKYSLYDFLLVYFLLRRAVENGFGLCSTSCSSLDDMYSILCIDE
jgi:hypothetical protein